jgi:methylmalonyl-CoA/ethylmalonyl-CoA epimerase
MMKISHIAIAVKNLTQASETFRRIFGVAPSPAETVASEKVSVTMFKFGGAKIELAESTDPASAVARFIEKRGEGIHHISFEVERLDAELARLKEFGFTVLDGYPRIGAGGYRVAFLHPKTTHGVLIELSERQY